MIRPFTFVALLLAGTSGLYLYQTKHRAEVLDGQIAHTLRQVAAARGRIGMLRAEWALLNEPDRLGQLAAQHLDLQPLQPPRFVAAADLPSRIPIPPAPVAAADAPVAEDTPASPPSAPLPSASLPNAPVRVVDATPIQVTAPAPAPAPTSVAPPRPHPARPTEHAWTAQRDAGHAAYSPASSFAVAAPQPRHPVFAPVLRTMATPIAAPSLAATQIGLVTARPSIPAVTSALGGFGRSSLAPPIPVGGR